MNTTTEEQIELLKRAKVVKTISEKLVQLPPVEGLGIALGIYLDVAKHHGVSADKAAEAVRNAWNADRDDFQVSGSR